tara:strand:- start:9646 stop:11565 length:1920 start_codon:yes stop_codon:yes gene_type:complete
MTERLPLVFVDGKLSQLPDGDTISGVNPGTLVAGSGLVGGGDLNTGTRRLDVALATNPSGVIFVNDAIGIDGSAEARADEATASGNLALRFVEDATNSGIAAQASGDIALASGNAALFNAVNFIGGSNLDIIADSDISPGDALALNDAGHVQSLGEKLGGGFVLVPSGLDTSTDTFGPNSTANNRDHITYDPVQSGFLITYEGASNFFYGRGAIISGNDIFMGTPVALVSFNNSAVDHGVDFDTSTNQFVVSTRTSATQVRSFTVQISGGTLQKGPDYNVTAPTSVQNVCLSYNPAFQKSVVLYTNFVSPSHRLNAFSIETSGNYVVKTPGTSNTTAITNTSHLVLPCAIYNPETSGNFFLTGYGGTNVAQIISTAPSGNNISIISNRLTPSVIGGQRGGLAYINSTKNIFMNYLEQSTIPVSTRMVNFRISAFDCPGSGFFDDPIIPYGQGQIGGLQGVGPVYDADYDRICVPMYSGHTSTGRTVAFLVKPSGTTSYTVLDHILISGTQNSRKNIDSIIDANHNVFIKDSSTSPASGYIWKMGPLDGKVPFPLLNEKPNFFGISKESAASGEFVSADLPRIINYEQENLETGRFYYVDTATSGFTTASGRPVNWDPNVAWKPVAKAVSSSGLLVLDTI